MPTVLTEGRFRVRILNPPREHGPAHVHVVYGKGRGAAEVIIGLGEPSCSGGPWGRLSIREVTKGLRDADVIAAVEIVQKHLDTLRRRWREIHG